MPEVGAVRGGAAVRSEVAAGGLDIEVTDVEGAVVGVVELLDGDSSRGGEAGERGLGRECSSNFGPGDAEGSSDALPKGCGGCGSVGASFCSIF
jgi:hypothetical protein